MKEPLVSVLIPCYNAEQYVEEAIRSIMNQTYSNLEIICINDGSTDNTGNILESLAKEDCRIKYIENEENIKLIATLNKGLKLCNGKYIARMDADDISYPNRIEKQVKFLEGNPDYGVVGSYMENFGDSKWWWKFWKTEDTDIKIRGFIIYGSPISHSAVTIRKSVIIENNIQYDKKYLHVEDYKLWYEISKYTKIANIPEVLAKYRLYKNQVSAKYRNIQIGYAKKLRREIISDFLEEYDVSICFDNISYKDIKSLSSINYHRDKYKVKYLKLVLYLSLRKYDFYSLMSFIFSGDVFIFSYKKSGRILLKFLFPNRGVSFL